MKDERRKILRRDEDELTKDRENLLYQQGLQNGIEHQQPSKETMEQIGRVKLDINSIQITMETINKNFDELKKENKEAHESIMKKIEDAMNTKADKTVVDELKNNQNKVVWLVISTVILGLLTLLFKNSL
jgi:Glu-tRNA(Gln) amidotransferase subunit E-like FAD-binding protein